MLLLSSQLAAPIGLSPFTKIHQANVLARRLRFSIQIHVAIILSASTLPWQSALQFYRSANSGALFTSLPQHSAGAVWPKQVLASEWTILRCSL